MLALYQALEWSSASKPEQLLGGLRNSDTLITAWSERRLVGLANAISDGHLVVYYPHVAVHPEFQRLGIGKRMMQALMKHYEGFHQHSLLADPGAVSFFTACGFQQSPCAALWIYDGHDH